MERVFPQQVNAACAPDGNGAASSARNPVPLTGCSTSAMPGANMVAAAQAIPGNGGARTYQCPYCPYSTSQAVLRSHIRTHTGEKPYACPRCPFRSATKSNLTLHIRSHTGEKPFSCPFCPFRAAVSSNLKIHIRSHTGERPYSCSRCDASFTHASHLKRHLKIHA
ncbi:zinc finger protein 771 [Penaeus vannamei]|uniref:C2H2-type domain-containing protein n=1 Tax=Penaeus vannamei TaxID=6689 RepID=A0A423TYJ9_PENVA|nr:zinc finger protein 513-like [Penaeus vannamei]ROT81537.1 hypothetical protein C7M84_025302 [Penaeus vannamei]